MTSLHFHNIEQEVDFRVVFFFFSKDDHNLNNQADIAFLTSPPITCDFGFIYMIDTTFISGTNKESIKMRVNIYQKVLAHNSKFPNQQKASLLVITRTLDYLS